MIPITTVTTRTISQLIIPFLTLFAFFFFNDTATTEIYTLSLHDALPISPIVACALIRPHIVWMLFHNVGTEPVLLLNDMVKAILRGPCICVDRKSTRLNSSHSQISYAVFCLKKKI